MEPKEEEEEDKDTSKRKSKNKDNAVEKKKLKDKSEKKDEEPSPDPEQVPKTIKAQVAAIVKYLKSIQAMNLPVDTETDLTDEIKAKLRVETPSTAEGRLSCYWKTPSTGVYLKSEKRECSNFMMRDQDQPYLLKLGATLKAAHLMVAWMNIRCLKEYMFEPRWCANMFTLF